MPPHHPDAVRQPEFIPVWHPTEVPPYQPSGALRLETPASLVPPDKPDAALHFGAPSSLDDAPPAKWH